MKIDNKCFNEELGKILRKIRHSKNMTIVEWSEATGINKDTISNFETGKHGISYLNLLIIREISDEPPISFFMNAKNILEICKL